MAVVKMLCEAEVEYTFDNKENNPLLIKVDYNWSNGRLLGAGVVWIFYTNNREDVYRLMNRWNQKGNGNWTYWI